MRYLCLSLVILFVGAVMIFAIQNLHGIDVAFLRMSVHTPVAFLIVSVYVLGAVSGEAYLH